MKKTTLSMLIALVLVLSVSVIGAFAQEWDEETVLTVFNDLTVAYPEAFADEDDVMSVDTGISYEGISKSVEEEDVVSKNLIDSTNGTVTGKFDPCGDGTVSLTIDLYRNEGQYSDDGELVDYYEGPENIAYIRYIRANVTVMDADGNAVYDSGDDPLKIKDCKSSGGDNCHAIYFDQKGHAKIKGYVQIPAVLTSDMKVYVSVAIKQSSYMTALWNPESYEFVVPADDVAEMEASSHDYCEKFLEVMKDSEGKEMVRGRYDINSGEARVQATLRNFNSNVKKNFVIPGEVGVAFADGTGGVYEESYDEYICKYTIYNTYSGAPQTEYCEYGKGIKLDKNAMIKFDITIEDLDVDEDSDGIWYLRVGGMDEFVTGILEAVERPCGEPAPVIEVMDPVKPFLTFYEQDSDDAIEPSGPYSVYEGGVWGMYEKCGRNAWLMVRLHNDGNEEAIIDLNKVAVAINGGTPMKFKWTMSTVSEGKKGIIVLGEDDEVTLIGRAHVTDIPSQLNSDAPMTAAVNFLDFGKYITGSLYSDRNNTRCVAP